MRTRANRRLLCRYTGDSAWYFARSSRDARAGIRAAGDDQALIEYHFLTKFSGGFAYAAHPVAIRATRVLDDRTEVLLDDHAYTSRPDHPYDVADHAIRSILPSGTSPHQLTGVCGLRVGHIDDRGLHLRLLQAPTAHLTLIGPPPSRWRQLLADLRNDTTEDGAPVLWDRPQLAAVERDFRNHHGEWDDEEAKMRWLTSGLLRRIGLWHTVSTAFCSRYWQRGDQTMIWELRHAYGVRPAHDELAAAFRNPVWGHPLTILKSHCDCHHRRPDPGNRPHPDFGRQCLFEFHHPDHPGVIQVRFNTEAPRVEDEPKVHAALTAARANAVWLERVLPARRFRATG
ncbi:hypothetical protein [Kitasatospora sp. NPDC087271]|uniref:hypothetical protein n=1 Tax=Kitasatospora sp. NPDC087271 TaxID=3364067 RepID=UPI0038106537